MAPLATYHDSDADDEYERSVMTSPILADDDVSTTDSDPPSTEPTPTTFGYTGKPMLSPGDAIVGWTSNQCAEYISTLGLAQYCDKFLENEIVGEALIALRHEELKEMAIMSVGHRLTILKGVYDVKVKQGIPVDPDHWVPPSAEATTQDQTATRDDISRIIQSMDIRDRKIRSLEADLAKLSDAYQKLREEILPMARLAKDRSQALPQYPGSAASPDFLGEDERSPRDVQGQKQIGGNGLSPAVTALNYPSVANAANGSQPSTSPSQANIPSPTSPNPYLQQPPLGPRTYNVRDQMTNGHGSANPRGQAIPRTNRDFDAPRTQQQPKDADDPPTSGGLSGSRGGNSSSGDAPSVEIFKSLRVSMDDPCEKVLPVALKKYNIHADWKNYALYIVHGDQERCLGLREKPLLLFKQLDKEGRKPMFMLRRHAAPLEGHSGPSGAGAGMGPGVGYDPTGGVGGTSRGHTSLLPGGII